MSTTPASVAAPREAATCSRCAALESRCNEANVRWQVALADLGSALQFMYVEIADYIRINKLGKVHHNQSMQMARDALLKHGKISQHEVAWDAPPSKDAGA